MDNYERSSRNCFSTPAVDRVSHKRHDEAWIASKLYDSGTCIVPVWQFKNLVTEGSLPRPVLLAPSEARGLIQRAESITLLGEADDANARAYFAVGLSPDGDAPPAHLAGLGQFRGLRAVGALLTPGDASLLAYARAIVYWHHGHRFCGHCGSPTTSAEGGHMRVCTNPQCGELHFPRTDPAVIVRVESGDGERCLLTRKAEWPGRMHSIIAGFVEPGESLEAAVVREVREETGVRIRDIRYFSSQPWPFPRSLMLGFTARAVNEEILLNDGELEDARWISREDIVREIQAGTLHLPSRVSISRRLIEAWFDAGSLGPLSEALSSPGGDSSR